MARKYSMKRATGFNAKYSLVYGLDELVSEYVAAQLGTTSELEQVAIGIARKGYLIGGVTFHSHDPGRDIIMALYIDDPGCMCRRDLVRQVLDYPFLQLGLKRVTAGVDKTNERCQKLLRGLGFQVEGVKRRAGTGGTDQLIFGLLKEDCKYYGQSTQATATA